MNRNLREYNLDSRPVMSVNTDNTLYPINPGKAQVIGDYSRRQSVIDNRSSSIYFDVKKNELVETDEYFYSI